MKAWIGVFALLGLMASGQAMADGTDGNALLRQCQHFIKLSDLEKNFDPFQAGICGGMVQGVQATVSFLSDDLQNDAKFCIPADVKVIQLVRIVVKFLHDNPRMLNNSRSSLIWLALKDSYPCK